MMEKFHFTHNGKNYDMPLLNNTKVKDQVKMAEAHESGSVIDVFKVIMNIAGEKATEAIEDMTITEFHLFMDDWTQSADVTPKK